MDKKDEESGDVIYSTLDDEPFQILHLNGDQVEYEKVTDYSVSSKSGGYWSCVKKCLVKAWETIPGPVKWLCIGACGTCLWGPNALSCSACLGCLGGAGAACSAGCVILK